MPLRTITMFQLSTLTKQRLRDMTEPVVAMGKDEKGRETPLAVIVPYGQFCEMQALLKAYEVLGR